MAPILRAGLRTGARLLRRHQQHRICGRATINTTQQCNPIRSMSSSKNIGPEFAVYNRNDPNPIPFSKSAAADKDHRLDPYCICLVDVVNLLWY